MRHNDFDPEGKLNGVVFGLEELQQALAKIKESEKEIQMVATIAQTLFERVEDLNEKTTEQDKELTDLNQKIG